MQPLKITRELKTSILVISSILLFIWGYSFLKGRDLFVDYKTLYVNYDNIEGLTPSAPITLNGFIIGKVHGLTLDPKTGKILVEMQIKSTFPISKTSVAEIYAPSPIGGKQIAIIPDVKNNVLTVDDDFLIPSVKNGLLDGVADKITPVKEKVEKLLENADELLINMNDILNGTTKQNLKNSIENLNVTLAQFSQTTKTVGSIVDQSKSKINSSFANVDRMTKNFASLSDTLSKIEITKTAKSLERTLANVDNLMSNLKNGKGTAGKLLTDETLYKNLNRTSKELELLLQDIRLKPTRYVNVSLFGKKNKPYLPPTDTIKN